MHSRSLLLVALAATVSAADTPVLPAAKTVSVSGTPATVSVVRFWQSGDGGASWSLAQQTSVPPEAKELPTWTFRPGKDGDYLLFTSTTSRDGKTEADPKPGEVPARAISVSVDTVAPAIRSLVASLRHDDPASPTATIQVAWQVTDTHLAATDVELSHDAGTTWIQAQTSGASGAATLTVPRDGTTLSLRLVAVDAAGNRATSPVQVLQIPAALKPEEVLAKAVEALPALPAVVPAAPTASTAPAVSSPSEAATVVVPEGSSLAGAPLLKEAPPAAPAGTTTVPVTAAPVPAAEPAPIAHTPRPVELPTATRYLQGAEAAKALAEARQAPTLDAALPLYLRLLDSSEAETARDELLAALAAANDPATVVAVVQVLTPDLIDDATRLRHGEALLRLGRASEAQQAVASVRRSSAQLRPALLVTAKALIAQGKQGQATRLIETLTTGDDAVAAEAKALRGK